MPFILTYNNLIHRSRWTFCSQSNKTCKICSQKTSRNLSNTCSKSSFSSWTYCDLKKIAHRILFSMVWVELTIPGSQQTICFFLLLSFLCIYMYIWLNPWELPTAFLHKWPTLCFFLRFYTGVTGCRFCVWHCADVQFSEREGGDEKKPRALCDESLKSSENV